MDTNDFPRTDAGLIDPSFDDLYIKCSFGNQIYYYGKGKHRGEYTLVAYIHSLIRGRNVVKTIREIDKDIPYYIEEGKTQLVIGIGCTGGFHRSVAITNKLSQILEEHGHRTIVNHRDLKR